MTTNIVLPDHTFLSMEILHSSISIELINSKRLPGDILYYIDIYKEGGAAFTFDESTALVAKYSAEIISLWNDGNKVGSKSVLVRTDGSDDLIV